MTGYFKRFKAGPPASRLIDTGQVGIVQASELPPPTLADLSRGVRPHLVGPFDRIAVEVLGLPELSRQVQVDASGRVIVLTTHKERAELKRDQILAFGPDARIASSTISMRAVIEPAEG